MAIESIGVTEQAEGVNVACMEAAEDDINKTEVRVIQQVDVVHAKKIGVAFGVHERTITVTDPTALTAPIVTPIADLIVTVGDNSVIEVGGVIDGGAGGQGFIAIIPIILDVNDSPIGVLPAKAASGLSPSGSGQLYYVDTNDITPFTPLLWWVGQYQKIALHCRIGDANNVKIWAKCHTGFPNDLHNMFSSAKEYTIGGSNSPVFNEATSGTKSN